MVQKPKTNCLSTDICQRLLTNLFTVSLSCWWSLLSQIRTSAYRGDQPHCSCVSSQSPTAICKALSKQPFCSHWVPSNRYVPLSIFGKGNFTWNFSTPSCSCADWRKTQYPSKHFFAVFATYEEWDFNSLPVYYRNSVFITLDTEHLAINTPPVNSTTTEDVYIPDAQNTDKNAHGKSRDERSSDLETETDDLCSTNMYALFLKWSLTKTEM